MFLFFDLGNVLLYFDHGLACRQLADVARNALCDVSAADVKRVLFESGLELESEAGRVGTDEFLDRLWKGLAPGGQPMPDPRILKRAASDIFWQNFSLTPLVLALASSRHRLGILSNTNEIHHEHFADGRYPLIPEAFAVRAYSFQLGCVKPQREIYEQAAALADVSPRDVFFVDDHPPNVAAARQFGFDAVHYCCTRQLAADLRRRGVHFNL